MTNFKIGGRDLHLTFTCAAMDAMEKRFGESVELNNIEQAVIQQTKDRKCLIAMLAIMANAGAEERGEPQDITEEWLAKHTRPGNLPSAQIAVIEAVADGMRMENGEGDEDAERDLVLEELKKKDKAGA